MEEASLLAMENLGECLFEVCGFDIAWYEPGSGVLTEGPSRRERPERLGLEAPSFALPAERLAEPFPAEAAPAAPVPADAAPAAPPAHPVVHYASPDRLEYLIVPSPRGRLPHLVMGPFLSVPVSHDLVAELLARNGLPADARQELANYLDSLPLSGIAKALHLARAALALLGADQPPVELLPCVPHPARRDPAAAAPRGVALDRATIEARYVMELRFRHALGRGDAAGIAAIQREAAELGQLPDRVAGDPLRSAKNLSVIANTICRLAAGDGGVHPLKIHALSGHFAAAIEKAASTAEIESLRQRMVAEYLALVRGAGNRAPGSHLAPVLDHIDFHLAEDLSLAALAARFGLSPSGLANRFQRKLGTTASEYVNRRRVEEASWYLANSSLSVKEIAALVGYSDPAWFSRRFRGIEGVGPLDWRRRRRA